MKLRDRLRSLPKDSADLRRLLVELAEKIERENKDREASLSHEP